jgi:hypothetical protein
VICQTTSKTVGLLWTLRAAIDDSPAYQREGGVWSTNRQQLFLDSLINRYDIPKLYFHDLQSHKGSDFQFAVIDGKQRLGAIFAFMNGDLRLDADFHMNDAVLGMSAYSSLPNPPSGGQAWSELTDEWKDVIRSIGLDVVEVRTDEPDEIEDLFFRLNNGEPLNAAEERNNIRGSMADLIREISETTFFSDRLRISDKRYKHREIAAKIVCLEHADWTDKAHVCDLKKRHLDDLCKNNASLGSSQVEALRKRLTKELAKCNKVFEARDQLLSKMAVPPFYYVWVKHVTGRYGHKDLHAVMRGFLIDFEVRRIQNLKLDEDAQDPGLTEFTRLSQQATNDKGNIERRLQYLVREFLAANPEVEVKDAKRSFTDEERLVIFELGGRTCAECGKSLASLDEMDADHRVQWSWGGATTMDNARCLCSSCNRGLAQKVQ